MVLYDLHTHSVRSDGCLPPAEIVREAAAAGLSALALTDHDTAEGCAEAAAEAARLGLRFFPGVEISAEEPPGVDKLQFADFIRAAACRTGQMLNIHDLAMDVGVSDNTAKR